MTSVQTVGLMAVAFSLGPAASGSRGARQAPVTTAVGQGG
jgi:hypothetical protein